MKKPAGGRKKPKAHVPHKTGGGAKRKGVRASGAPVPGGRAPAQHHAHHPPGHRMTNPLVPAPHHQRHVKAKKPVKRKLASGDGVACCAAEALAASLRLAGVPVGDEDVLALYWRTAADADAGATILATLEAAREHGLGAFQLASFRPAECDWNLLAGSSGIGQAVHHFIQGAAGDRKVTQQGEPFRLGPVHPASVVLGVTLPGGPHALTLDASGAVWSWGDLYDLPDLGPGSIEEAWSVQWAA